MSIPVEAFDRLHHCLGLLGRDVQICRNDVDRLKPSAVSVDAGVKGRVDLHAGHLGQDYAVQPVGSVGRQGMQGEQVAVRRVARGQGMRRCCRVEVARQLMQASAPLGLFPSRNAQRLEHVNAGAPQEWECHREDVTGGLVIMLDIRPRPAHLWPQHEFQGISALGAGLRAALDL
jgi:hypothetical protein